MRKRACLAVQGSLSTLHSLFLQVFHQSLAETYAARVWVWLGRYKPTLKHNWQNAASHQNFMKLQPFLLFGEAARVSPHMSKMAF